MDTPEILGLSAVAFAAGFVDAIAGGGGLLQMPSLFLAGVPAPALFGVNKVSSVSGTSAALVRYARSGSVRWRVLAVAAPIAFAGSVAGTFLLVAAVKAAAAAIRPVFACLFVALAVHQVRRALAPVDASAAPPRARPGIALGFVGAIGLYDGLVGPGTGMFLFWALTTWLGLPPLAATGTTKGINWITNAGALATLIAKGHVLWPLALSMGSANLLGGWTGAHTAIRRGVRFIRVVTAVVSGVAAAYLLADWARSL